MACDAAAVSRIPMSNTQSPGVSMRTCLEMTAWQCDMAELHCFKLRGGGGSLHLWIRQQQTPTELWRGNASVGMVYLGWTAARKCTIISYNLQKRSMSRKREETSLAPAIWSRKQYFLIPSLIKEDTRWLFLRELCVLLAGRMKDERLVVMEICSRDAHGATEAMPHKSTYALTST